MKELLIIAPKDSLLNTYLQNAFHVYEKITELEDRVCYKLTGSSHPMESINYLVTMFMLSDFCITCDHGDYIFRVRS